MLVINLVVKRWACLLLPSLLAACATVAPSVDSVDAEPEVANTDISWVAPTRGEGSSVNWQARTFPGKQSTVYRTLKMDGREVCEGKSSNSASMLRQTIRVEAADLAQLRFSWKVPGLIAGADMTQRETDDSPVRVILAFDGDRSKFSAKNAMLSELAHTLTGEPMPYATLMYVWGNKSEAETVIINPRTDRIRKLIVESGPKGLNHWLDYERDIRADYLKAFGEEPGALVGIGIMTDSDNTRQQALGWYGPVTLAKAPVTLASETKTSTPGAR